MGGLEIQLLAGDTFAHHALEIIPGIDDHVTGGTCVRVVADLAAALPGIANFTPLMISLDCLLSHRSPSVLGQEYFSVDVRLAEPVRFPDERLDGGPERFDVISLTCGDAEFSAMIPQDAAWPHVMVHRVYPRARAGQPVSPAFQRAFFAALRDAVRPLVARPTP